MIDADVAGLSGLPLNWVVAFALGQKFENYGNFWGMPDPEDSVAYDVLPDFVELWGAGGKLMDLENIGVKAHFDPVRGNCFLATAWNDSGSIGVCSMLGSTKLEAVARCFAFKRLESSVVKIPKELLELSPCT